MGTLRNEEISAVFVGLFIGATVISGAAIYLTIKAPEERARKEKYLADRQCKVAGFYGRSGEYIVYECMGVLIKEQDI